MHRWRLAALGPLGLHWTAPVGCAGSRYEAGHAAAAIAELAAHAIDVLLLGDLDHAADSPAVVRTIRSGEHPRSIPGSR